MSDLVQLGIVVDINPESIQKNYPFDKIEYIDISSVGTGVLNGIKTIPIAEAPSRAKRIITNGDTILSTVRPNRRSFLYIKSANPNTIVSTGFAVLRAKKDIDKRYLYYFVNHQSFTDYLTNRAKGAAYPAVDNEIISNAKIPLPPLPTQRKIAGVLSAYDDLIENNTRRIAILEEMAQRIYKEWFVDFKYPGHENDTMVDSELGMIPEGWEVKKLGDFGEVITGKTPSKKVDAYYGVDIPFIKTPDMHGNIFCISTNEYLSNFGAVSQKKKTLPINTLLVSCIGTAGIVSITAIPSQTNQQINAIIPSNCNYRELLYFSLLDLKDTIRLHGATGATMVNLNKGKFEALIVVFPSETLISDYHKIAQPIFDKIINAQYKNQTLRQTRDLLLPKLISGKVDVSELGIVN